MKDYYLKSPDKDSLINDLKNLTFMKNGEETGIGFVVTNEEEEEVLSNSGHGFALDYIGKIVTTPGTYDEEGVELTAPVLTDDVHANIRVFSIAKKIGSVHKVYDDTEEKLSEVLDNAVFTNGTELLEEPSTPVRVFA